MRLKHYQEKVLNTLKDYLNSLNDFKAKYEKALDIDPDFGREYDFPKLAFTKTTNRTIYSSKVNGLREPLPNICLKVPTGGGKTLLACHSVSLIQSSYLKRRTGLVLWIVPSTQIYRQTIRSLKDRSHPYRQVLDVSSGARTLIKEKTEAFSRLDTDENLVVLMLMLPSANRQNKETLKVFRDSGNFTDFFPNEDDYQAQQKLLGSIPNLDTFGRDDQFFGRQIKTSLGNTLKVLRPLVVIDEGHKAYGELARNTIAGFNPSFVLELSATPPKNSNELVKITGRELHDEEMIKLDIHLVNKVSFDWKNTLLSSLEKRVELEKKAIEFEQNTGQYIRPICLIQVERTGRDQREKRYIHAEDAKEYLIKECGVPEGHIAIKSSEKDDIEGIDLFARDCEIRYIITKQALQEGWDCSFAYILTILTNPSSATGITQLVGRILRQPNAVKTKVPELDECYIYTYKPNAAALVSQIKKGLETEGLGDISGRLVSDDSPARVVRERELDYRPGFKKFEGKIYLPRFVIQEKERWRDVIFEVDILQGIDWTKLDVSSITEKTLGTIQTIDHELTLGLSQIVSDLVVETGRVEAKRTLEIDRVFLARQLGDIIPNPWIAFEIGQRALEILATKYDTETIASNFLFVIEELKRILERERNRLAEELFRKLLDTKKIYFFLVREEGHHLIPSRVKVQSAKQLVRNDNSPVQNSLFTEVPDEDFNAVERSVALYLDQQEQLLWWYRNRARKDFHIQGWRRNKIFPDFIAATVDKDSDDEYKTVFVLETKGIHLKENDDTRYKKDIFTLCNELGSRKAWEDISEEFPDHNFEFQVIFEDEWQNKINALLSQ